MQYSRPLTANNLKLIAVITMTIDHIGWILFPQYEILRIIGRIAFPLFAFMIAEGCFYTRNIYKYLTATLITGLSFQIIQYIYYLSANSTSTVKLNIMLTFSLSILINILIKNITRRPLLLIPLTGIISSLCITEMIMPVVIYKAHTGLYPVKFMFAFEYGFFGVLFPVCLFLFRWLSQKHFSDKIDFRFQLLRLCVFATMSFLVSIDIIHANNVTHKYVINELQIWGLMACLPVALYNDKRTKKYKNKYIKYIWYAYYPAHIMILWLLATIVK